MQDSQKPSIILKEMNPDDIAIIGQVNRRETVEAEYVPESCCNGRGLVLSRIERKPPDEVPAWNENDVAQRIAEWRPKIDNGGSIIGAFDGPRLVGFVVLGHKEADSSAELVALFVDSVYRKAGIGSLLFGEAENRARDRGIVALSIGSNRTASAVEFYLKHGCKVIALADDSLISCRGARLVFGKKL